MAENELIGSEVEIPSKKEKKISGTAKKRKPKWTDVFVAEDISNVKSYIYRDVFIPNIKKLIHDIVTNGIDMFLYKDASGPSKGSTISRPSYGKYYKDKERGNNVQSRSQERDRYSYSDVILDSRSEAEDVIRMLDESCQAYEGVASVADLYDIVGLDHKYTDNNYGWTRAMLRDVKVLRVPEGYLLKFPRPVPLD